MIETDVAGMRALAAAIMRETELESQVEGLLKKLGWRYFHTYNSERSAAGFPDLCAVRGQRLLFAELKTEEGKLKTEQEEWLRVLWECGGYSGRPTRGVVGATTQPHGEVPEVYLWRPSDLFSGEIARILA